MPPPPPPAAGCTTGSPGWPTNPGWTQTTATTATLSQCGWNAQAGAMNVPSTAGSTLSCLNGVWTVQPYGTAAATCVAPGGVGRRMQEDAALELDAGEEIGGR